MSPRLGMLAAEFASASADAASGSPLRWTECGKHTIKCRSPSHGENRGSSPLGSANKIKNL